LAAAVKAYRPDEFAAPTANVGMGGSKLTNLANGTVATDAATYGQLLNLLNGTDWKDSVRVATTANLAAMSGVLTIDDVTLVAGDRVLVNSQDTASQNGLYVVASGAWTRAADADTTLNPDGSSKLSASTTVFVEEGSTLADIQWRITTNGAIVLGTTAIAWGPDRCRHLLHQRHRHQRLRQRHQRPDHRRRRDLDHHGYAQPVHQGRHRQRARLRDAATDEFVECGIKPLSTTQATFSFGAAPALNSLRVVVDG
jgi:hypothetical protein